jgi:hypothetical protein
VPGDGNRYLPVSEDVEIVLFYLRMKGLPTELGVKVIEYADFKPERRLKVANDPLDARNREELTRYLSWCWKVLVWCDVFMTEDGRKIAWQYEISDVIRELWGGEGNGGKKMWRYLSMDEETEIDIAHGENGESYRSIPFRKVVFT